MSKAKINLANIAVLTAIHLGLLSCKDQAKNLPEAGNNNAISCATNSLTAADSSDNLNEWKTDFQPTVLDGKAYTGKLPEGMVFIPGGEFSMGGSGIADITDRGSEAMNDARPVHRVKLKGFFMDITEVTNRQFAAFVKATGYVTIAEQTPDASEFPGVPTESLVPGSLVFKPAQVNNLSSYSQWWSYVPGASWQHPEGPASNLQGKEEYPVVHIAWQDAQKYAKWAKKRLPTEAEWEYAARGGQAGNLFAWGNLFRPEGKWVANTYQGKFPQNDDGCDGYSGIAPVKKFPTNPYGLFDIAGNVWEWCADWYRNDYYRMLKKITTQPQGPKDSFDPSEPGAKKKVMRGGSYLCTDQYCSRYVIGSRGKGEYRTSSNHIGFRCVKDLP